MRLAKTEAIVLHTYPARDRDKLVVFLTPDHGKVRGWAYGARGIRSRFGASLEPLAKIRIGYAEREAEEEVRIESAELIRSLFPAQQDLVSSVGATYIAELVDTFAQPGDPAELIYRLLDRCAEAILAGERASRPQSVGVSPAGRNGDRARGPITAGETPALHIVAYAEIWILKLAGTFPSTRVCVQCGGPLGRPLRFDSRLQGFVCDSCATRDAFVISNDVVEELEAILRLPVAEFAARKASTEAIFEIRSLAGSIRRYFLGHELKSFEVLASVIGSVP